MFNLLLGGPSLPPNTNPLIATVQDELRPKIEIQVPPEMTVEEKIRTNFYKCDTETTYIRADDATCLAKPVSHTTPAQKTATARPTLVTRQNIDVAPAGWFPKGQCTWYVWSRRPVPKWNNASDWKWQAERDGWIVSTKPVAGAIGWTYGHVVYVERVNSDGTILISEANYDYRGSIRTITVPISKYPYYLF